MSNDKFKQHEANECFNYVMLQWINLEMYSAFFVANFVINKKVI